MKTKRYNFKQNNTGDWIAYHDDTIICGSFKTQEDAVLALARYIEMIRLREKLTRKGIEEEKLYFKSYKDLQEIEKQLEEKMLFPQQIEKAKGFRQANDFKSFIGIFYSIYESDNEWELSIWTDAHIELSYSFNKSEGCPFEQFNDFVQDFDIDKHVDEHREHSDYCQMFSIRKSLEDFENLHKFLKEIASLI